MRTTARVVAMLAVLSITATGCLWSWGPQSRTVLGQPDDALEPALVGSDAWRAVSVGDLHSCGITLEGALFCWGSGDVGALGLGTSASHATPVQVGQASDWTTVEAIGHHTCGIRGAGELYCWGLNWTSQLAVEGWIVQNPTRVGTWSDWTHVSGGTDHTCGIRSSGDLYCWGWNWAGRAGQPGVDDVIGTPTRVEAGGGWTAISGSGDYTCGLQASVLRCWGLDPSVGGPQMLPPDPHVPRAVSELSGWTDVEAASGHLCGIRAGEISCLGANGSGQLGDGTRTTRTTLTPVAPTGAEWADVSGTSGSTCAITVTHELWCWGSNVAGRLGDGTTVDRLTPTRIGTASDWVDVALGHAGSYGVTGASD